MLDTLDLIWEAFRDRLIEAFFWNWQNNTLICLGITLFFLLWFWLDGLDLCKKKYKQWKWRRKLKGRKDVPKIK